MKASDGSLLGEPGRTVFSKKNGIKWQRPRLTRQALLHCCLVKWILSSAAPQGSGMAGAALRGWGMRGCSTELREQGAASWGSGSWRLFPQEFRGLVIYSQRTQMVVGGYSELFLRVAIFSMCHLLPPQGSVSQSH